MEAFPEEMLVEGRASNPPPTEREVVKATSLWQERLSPPPAPSPPRQCFCPAHPRWNLHRLKPSAGRAGFESQGLAGCTPTAP